MWRILTFFPLPRIFFVRLKIQIEKYYDHWYFNLWIINGRLTAREFNGHSLFRTIVFSSWKNKTKRTLRLFVVTSERKMYFRENQFNTNNNKNKYMTKTLCICVKDKNNFDLQHSCIWVIDIITFQMNRWKTLQRKVYKRNLEPDLDTSRLR